MKPFKNIFTLLSILFFSINTFAQNTSSLPNIVVIVSDDQGYADASYQSDKAPLVNTPAIDKLAESGIVMTNGYASAYVCAPTRAGLLTGRYQQRFGFYRASDSRIGMPLNEITLPELLKKKGYVTGAFGKWHLGLKKEFRPNQRGFDEFYGFLGHGAHDYFDLTCKENGDDFHQCIYRNNQAINDSGYLTDNLAKEAISFIEKHSKAKKPFFLYLPFNAVHFPMQAPEKDIALFNTDNYERNILLAMLHRMDIAIGNVIETLKKQDVYQNTLIIFFSDNGGAKKNHSVNAPLRDYKHSVYEGGIRVPFIVSWPKILKPGTNDESVISLDIMPTICDVVGIPLPDDRVYDGKNMLPHLLKKANNPLHEELFWDGDEKFWSMRKGQWKLVSNKKGELELYDLKTDIGESKNLAEKFPDRVEQMKEKYTIWRKSMGKPMGKVK